MTEPPVTITLPGERPQSWNKSYAGQHWAKRKAEVERIRMAVRAVIDPETCQVFAGQVDITVTVFFDKRPLDADNVPAKFYVDACKGWLLVDDDQHHVRSVRTVVEVDRSRPRVMIEIKPVEIYHTPAGVFDLLGMPPYGVPAEVVEASRHRCIEVEQTGRQAGVAERYELQPAPEGSRVLVAEPAAGSGAFLRLDF